MQSFLLICLLISVSQAEVHLIGPVDQGRLFVASELRPSPLPAKLTGRLDLPNDPMLSAQWYLLNFGQRSEKGVSGFAGADIHLFSALQYFRPQRQVTVAVIDSGIDLTHEDVSKDVLWVNSGEIAGNGIDDDGNGYIDDVHGLNFTAQTHDVQDKHYHGTHVTSLLSAATHNSRGIAGAMPWLRIMPVVIFGLGTTASGDQIAEGIRYACDHGAKVLSNSWGSRNANPKMLEAIQYCDSLGVLFVNAAGNSRENVDSTPQFPTNYQVRNQIVVGATDNRDCSALFSNYGTQVDIAAPGDSVLSLMPKNHYRTLSGTSQATPLVAGAIAMLWANEPELTHMQVKERLMYTADQLPQLSRWVRTSGRLNIENLLRNQAGQLLPKIPIHEVRVRDFHLETLHPFAKDQFHVWRFTFEGATAVRFRLAKFELDTFGDYLEIRDGTGRVIEKLNGVLPDNSFTNWVYSESVILEFSSNKSLQSYGFTIDGVETLENPQL